MAMSTKILEFGFCEGWTSVCVWMREAQFDLGFDWLPACTTLTAPALVRGLLPVMRVVTRRIMNRPAVSKAAVSERLMAAEVAEGLEESTVEACAPVLRTTVRQLWRSWTVLYKPLASSPHIMQYTAASCNAAQIALVPSVQAP